MIHVNEHVQWATVPRTPLNGFESCVTQDKKKKNCLCNYTIQNTQWGIQQLLKNLAASTQR